MAFFPLGTKFRTLLFLGLALSYFSLTDAEFSVGSYHSSSDVDDGKSDIPPLTKSDIEGLVSMLRSAASASVADDDSPSKPHIPSEPKPDISSVPDKKSDKPLLTKSDIDALAKVLHAAGLELNDEASLTSPYRGADSHARGDDVVTPGGDVVTPGGDVVTPGGDVVTPGGDVVTPGGDAGGGGAPKPVDGGKTVEPEDGGDKPAGEGGDKPAGEGGDKPAGEGGDKPAGEGGDKPAGEGGDKPTTCEEATTCAGCKGVAKCNYCQLTLDFEVSGKKQTVPFPGGGACSTTACDKLKFGTMDKFFEDMTKLAKDITADLTFKAVAADKCDTVPAGMLPKSTFKYTDCAACTKAVGKDGVTGWCDQVISSSNPPLHLQGGMCSKCGTFSVVEGLGPEMKSTEIKELAKCSSAAHPKSAASWLSMLVLVISVGCVAF